MRSRLAFASIASDLLLETLRDVAIRAGYGGTVVDEARQRWQYLPAAEALPVSLRSCYGSEPLPALVALLALGNRVLRPDAERALKPLDLDELVQIGLFESSDDQIRSRFQAAVYDGLLLLGDSAAEVSRDFVSPLFAPSRLLAWLTPRAPRESMLDLGTGSGIQALLAARHCKRVVGIDINPHALVLSDMNARMNRIRNVDWRLGRWLEPAAGETFDLIVCNPPYVLSPDCEFAYRDSGMPSGALIAQLCRDIPLHLNDGGLAIILAMWPHAERGDWDVTPEAWIQASGCAGIAICFNTRTAFDDAVSWNSPPSSRGSEPAVLSETVLRWDRYHRENRIGAISFGAVVLRRRAGRKRWSLVVRASAHPGDRASRQIERAIAGNDLLQSGDDVFSRSYAVPTGLSVSQRFERRERGWTSRLAMVTVPGELALTAGIDPDALDVLFRCEGEKSIREISDGKVDTSVMSTVLRELLAKGLLDIVRAAPIDKE